MERAATVKLAFLVALLLIGSCLPRGIEAQQKPVECQKPSDCVGKCHGCTANQCTAGLCVCGCALPHYSVKQEKPVQCEKPEDCISRCNGCTVNKCTAGLCVCGC